jgi:hypothetical protein
VQVSTAQAATFPVVAALCLPFSLVLPLRLAAFQPLPLLPVLRQRLGLPVACGAVGIAGGALMRRRLIRPSNDGKLTRALC